MNNPKSQPADRGFLIRPVNLRIHLHGANDQRQTAMPAPVSTIVRIPGTQDPLKVNQTISN
jgi:hypothetical protein